MFWRPKLSALCGCTVLRPRARCAQSDRREMASLQDQARAVAQALQGYQTEIAKFVQTRTQLGSQVNENEMVLEELTRLKEDANVFKMIGPGGFALHGGLAGPVSLITLSSNPL